MSKQFKNFNCIHTVSPPMFQTQTCLQPVDAQSVTHMQSVTRTSRVCEISALIKRAKESKRWDLAGGSQRHETSSASGCSCTSKEHVSLSKGLEAFLWNSKTKLR